MMVETIFESSQDFGMSNGTLPQWKRELLQRRAARSRPAPAAPAPPPPPPPPQPPTTTNDDDNNDEELRYGPGIVKRLKSRYLSLALRDAPRRRPSVLRRAASLEHLLDERPPRAPRPARPASLAAPAPLAPSPRREFVKRARSVDALSRLDSCEAPAPPSPSPPPPPPPPTRPLAPRSARPPRRPAPLLRDAERPPPDLVRSTLRKFESAPAKRPAPAARVSAVLRGLEGPRRSLTPERQEEIEARSPSPTDAPPGASPTPPASSPAPPPTSPAPPPTSPAPPLSPAPPVSSPAPPTVSPPPPVSSPPSSPAFSPALPDFSPAPPTSPAPPPPPESPPPSPPPPSSPPSSPPPAPAPSLPAGSPPPPTTGAPALIKVPGIRGPPASPPESQPPAAPEQPAGPRVVARAALDSIARAGSSVRYTFEAARGGSHLPPLAATNPVLVARRVGVIRPMPASPRSPDPAPAPALVNGHSTPEPRVLSRIGAAGIERAWSGSAARVAPAPEPEPRAPWPRAAARGRAPPPAATSIVFNFSDRKEVPDYIENDGIILRASRRNRIKAGGGGGGGGGTAERRDSGSSGEEAPDGGGAGPAPARVRFLNDNVLINGRSSMAPRSLRDPGRIAKLKLQFDDSLTRTFEYPSETSLCEHGASPPPAPPAPPAPAPAPAPVPATDSPDAPNAHLADNTHIASAALSRYTPSKTPAAAFQLGVTRRAPEEEYCVREAESGCCAGGAGGPGAERGHAVPCGADAARSWSEARTANTDLLF